MRIELETLFKCLCFQRGVLGILITLVISLTVGNHPCITLIEWDLVDSMPRLFIRLEVVDPKAHVEILLLLLLSNTPLKCHLRRSIHKTEAKCPVATHADGNRREKIEEQQIDPIL